MEVPLSPTDPLYADRRFQTASAAVLRLFPLRGDGDFAFRKTENRFGSEAVNGTVFCRSRE